MSPPVPPATARLLLLDDDSAVAAHVSRELRLDGCEVWSTRSPDQGLVLAVTHRPDAVIVSLRAPLADGLSFLRRFRALPSMTDTPIAIVTADLHADGREARALGATILYKPVWLRELLVLARDLIAAPIGS